ncbi:hypothetical protein EYR40_008860 [Pleurotus pulmonarius]|nr:hypothetical protein EYR36_009681 [Pleurotus pulmonarius]KAF4594061.1 hypothetical protein EYR40_008860 [Pleurotus pulmonarius]
MGGFVVNIGGVEHTLRLDDIVPQPSGSKEYPRIPWPAVEGSDINDKSKIDGIAKTLVTVQTTWFIVQLLIRAIERLAVTELEVMTLAYALMCAFLYGFWWNKPYDVHKPILTGTTDQLEVAESPRRSMSLTSLLDGDWIMYLHGTIVEDTRLDYLSEVAPDRNGRIAIVISIISATLFGSIHCIAWNFQFPTPIERIIWISSSLVIVAVPPLWVCEAVTVIACKATEIRPSIRNALVAPRYVILAVSVYAYFLARVLLIVQAFVLLRELPPSAEQSVRWTYFLPHI